jgi:hypothetical protein
VTIVGLIEIDLQDLVFAKQTFHPHGQDDLADLAFNRFAVCQKEHLRDLLRNRTGPLHHLASLHV